MIDGDFHLVDDFDVENTYAADRPYQLLITTLVNRAGGQEWRATGTPTNWLPLRHRSKDENGQHCLLRIVKSPMSWGFEDGSIGHGSCEIHDRLDEDGVPIGLHD